MKACRRARRRIEAAFDGTLSLSEEFLLEEHVRDCPRCRARLRGGEALADLLLALPDPPEENLDLERSVAGVRAALDQGDRGLGDGAGERRPRPAPGRRALAVAAAAAAALALGLWLARPHDGERAAPVGGDRPLAAHDGPSGPSGPSGQSGPSGPSDRPASGPAQAVAAVVVHPPLASPLHPTDLDVERLARAQAQVRAHLARAAEDRLPDRVGEFLARFDELAAPLEDGGWPVGRMVAQLVADPDPRVAGAAARYAGRRPDRLVVRRLEEALDRPSVRVPATLALADAGDLGERALARAFWVPELSGLVRGRMVERAQDPDRDPARPDRVPARVVAWVKTALAAAPREPTPRQQALAAGLPDILARCGPEGAEALLGLAGEPLLRDDLVLDALAAAPGAEAALAASLEGRPGAAREAFLLYAVERLKPAGSYEWVRERAWHGHDRGAAALALATFTGVAPVRALLELSQTRRLTDGELLAAFRRAVAVDPERALSAAWEHVERGDGVASGRYLEWLVRAEHGEAVPAVLVLVEHAALPDEGRELALLAAGELGGPEHVVDLTRLLEGLSATDRELAAACLLAIHRLGGEQATLDALADASPRTRARALELCAGGRGPAVTLFHLAHALEPLLRARDRDAWRTLR